MAAPVSAAAASAALAAAAANQAKQAAAALAAALPAGTRQRAQSASALRMNRQVCRHASPAADAAADAAAVMCSATQNSLPRVVSTVPHDMDPEPWLLNPGVASAGRADPGASRTADRSKGLRGIASRAGPAPLQQLGTPAAAATR